MKHLVFAFVVAVALLAGTARAATPELTTHEATEKTSAITIRLAGTLKIVLPAMSKPGHEWQIMSNDPRVLKVQAALKPVDDAKAAGKAVPWEITFVAQRPGRSLLRFIYTTRSAADVATPDEIREITVRVQ